MRDLEEQIAEWRRTLVKTSGRRAEAVNELEAHLREEIGQLMAGGAPGEKAFELAVSKLGAPSALSAEFVKLEQMRRTKWKPAILAQWACMAVAVLAAAFLIPRIGGGRMTALLASHVLSVTIGYVTMFILGGLAICYILAEWFQQTGPSQRYALGRVSFQLAIVAAALTTIGIVLGMVWAKQNWGRYWAWDPKETGGAAVLACAVATVALRWFKPASHGAVVVAGVLGSVCTAVAWFGVNAAMGLSAPVIVFIAIHLLALLVFSAARLRRRESLN